MESVLITGAGGFLGEHICKLLVGSYNITGVDLPGISSNLPIDWVEYHKPKDWEKIIREVKPNYIIHAAFINKVPNHVRDDNYINNMLSSNIPLFKAANEFGSKVILISSSAVYCEVDRDDTLDESSELNPHSLYGLSKMIQESAARFYIDRDVEIVRLFNLCGPGQRQGMLMPDWVKKVTEAKRRNNNIIKVKHKQTSRDFVDVRDSAKAIKLMLSNFLPNQIFNIASGIAVSLNDIAKELENICEMSLILEETDSSVESQDVLQQVGNYEKVKEIYGWTPTIDWRTSLKDLWESNK